MLSVRNKKAGSCLLDAAAKTYSGESPPGQDGQGLIVILFSLEIKLQQRKVHNNDAVRNKNWY